VCAAALALAALGCGAEERVNEPRPSPPTRVSVAISTDSITVQPSTIGVGPERTELIEQNRSQSQPPIRTNAPLTVVFVTANLTNTDSQLEIHGPRDATSNLIVANGNSSYQIALPAGSYTIAAADIPAAKSARLLVGRYRASSQNDVLLP
jgi:hypothetical protein